MTAAHRELGGKGGNSDDLVQQTSFISFNLFQELFFKQLINIFFLFKIKAPQLLCIATGITPSKVSTPLAINHKFLSVLTDHNISEPNATASAQVLNSTVNQGRG